MTSTERKKFLLIFNKHNFGEPVKWTDLDNTLEEELNRLLTELLIAW